MYSDEQNNSYMSEEMFLAAAGGADGHVVQRLSDTRRTPMMVGGIICAVLAVVCLSCFTYMLFLTPSHTASAIVLDGDDEIGDVSDQRAGITLPIYIPELDARGSRIPVALTGTLADGSEFSKDTYVAKDGSGLILEPGTYELHVSGSPISSSGVMYQPPEESITITVTDDLTSSYSPDGFMYFSVIAAIGITDEQIDAACELVKKDPERTQYADNLAEQVRERRSEAIAADKAAKAAKEEAVRVVAEQQLVSNQTYQDSSAYQSNQQTQQDSSYDSSTQSGSSGNAGSGGNSHSESGITEDDGSDESYGGGGSSSESGSGSGASEEGYGGDTGAGTSDGGGYGGGSESSAGGSEAAGAQSGESSGTGDKGEVAESTTTVVESNE